MERGTVVFGALFLVIPLLLALGVFVMPTAAFGFTLAIIAILALGFTFAIAFVDVNEG